MTNSVRVDVVVNQSELRVGADFTILWDDYSTRKDAISLPEYVEAHADRLRLYFAEFIDQVAQTSLGGGSVSELLLIREDFSFWWMTLFASTRWDPTSNITHAIKLLAFAEICSQISATTVSVRLSNDQVSAAIHTYCKSKNIATTDTLTSHNRSGTSLLRFRAVAATAKFAVTHRRINALESKSLARTLVVDHFVRFNESAIEDGKYDSQYWKVLDNLFPTIEHGIRWMHHFVPGFRSIQTTEQLLTTLNEKSINKHAQFESRLTASCVFPILRELRQLRRVARKSNKKSSFFVDTRSGVDFTALFAEQWNESLCGSTATRHLIILRQQEAVLKSLPSQKNGLFLCENQPWEAAFAYAWHRYGHGKLTAVVHAPIRFWDFRYFTLARALRDNQEHATRKPTPSVVAVNSEISRSFMEIAQAPADRILEVESLMFNHLVAKNIVEDLQKNVLLIVGDFFPHLNERLIALVKKAKHIRTTNLEIVFKPHPMNSNMPDFSGLPSVRISITDLGDLLPRTHTAISCNSSTAALECFLYGVKTISYVDPEALNSSPLRGVSGAVFVTSSDQLDVALTDTPSGNHLSDSLLILDPATPRWKALLA
jgi:surface carbohydrate biosynthesis protein (TIGR04326 family)